MAVTQTHGVLVPFVNFLATAELLVAIARRKVIAAGNRCARKKRMHQRQTIRIALNSRVALYRAFARCTGIHNFCRYHLLLRN